MTGRVELIIIINTFEVLMRAHIGKDFTVIICSSKQIRIHTLSNKLSQLNKKKRRCSDLGLAYTQKTTSEF